jgi:hypothetical protein
MRNFSDHIFGYCEGLIEFRALPSRRQVFFYLSDKDQMKRFISQHYDNELYYGVATRDGAGGRKDNIVNIPAVWCDVDFKNTDRKAVFEKLKQFPFAPSAKVFSGGGEHLYWLLDEPVGKDAIETVEEVNRRIAGAIGGDFGSVDAAHILRIPGTRNYKPKYESPPLVKVSELNNFCYALNDFLDILPEVKSNGSLSKNTSGNPQGWLLEALKGVCAHDPGRDKTGAKIAGYFVDKLNYNDVLTILLAWNAHNQPPMAEKDVRRIVNSVSRYKKNEAHNEPPMERVTVSFNRS